MPYVGPLNNKLVKFGEEKFLIEASCALRNLLFQYAKVVFLEKVFIDLSVT